MLMFQRCASSVSVKAWSFGMVCAPFALRQTITALFARQAKATCPVWPCAGKSRDADRGGRGNPGE
jgi:hypothetical protein